MEEKKICSKCKKEKPVTEFHKDKTRIDGLYGSCKECKKDYMSERWKNDPEYRAKRKEYSSTPERREYYRGKAEEYRTDPVKRKLKNEYMKEYWKKHDGSEYNRMLMDRNPEYRRKVNNKAKVYRENNREKVLESNKKSNKKRMATQEYKDWRNKYEKNKRDNDPKYRAELACRARVNKLLKSKAKSSILFFGCSVEFLMEYLQDRFTNGMSWDNYGKLWHIDHIVPCGYFDLTELLQQNICFNYRNIQPLTVSENCSKQDDLPENYLEIIEEIKTALKL